MGKCLRSHGKYSTEEMVTARQKESLRTQGKRTLDVANRVSVMTVETAIALGLQHPVPRINTHKGSSKLVITKTRQKSVSFL